jgi:hypothetical protein
VESLVIPRALGKRAERRWIGTDPLAQAADSVDAGQRAMQVGLGKSRAAAFPARDSIAEIRKAFARDAGRALEPAAMAAKGDVLPGQENLSRR